MSKLFAAILNLMLRKTKKSTKIGIVLFVLLLIPVLIVAWGVNTTGSSWRCIAWAQVDKNDQLSHCYSRLDNWNLPESRDWTVYDNPATIFKFVFKYPLTWTISEAKGVSGGMPTSTVVGVKREDKVGVTFATANWSYQDSLNRSYEYYNDIDQIIDKKEIVIDGKRAIRKIIVIPVSSGNSKEDKSVHYYIEKGKDRLDIIELYEIEDYKLTDQDIQEFDLMMKTLNFPD